MSADKSIISFGEGQITIDDIVAIANNKAKVRLSANEDFKIKIEKGAKFLEKLLQEDGVIYGVTTGYGDSCTVNVPAHLVHELPIHLTRYHGCGLGRYFNQQQTQAILAARLTSLSQGYSGVRPVLLEQLTHLINHQITPLIPEEGSVGASGDLTPLSYVGAALIGERDAIYNDEQKPIKEIYKSLNLEPISLAPKEGLAIMNGTAVMTAIACLAWQRAEYLTRLSTRITSLASLALLGNSAHFDDILFSVKPHQGQQKVAERT